MTLKLLCILLLALVAAVEVLGQSENIPIENDNQFPLDNPSDPELGAVVEGSGDGNLEEPPTNTVTETTPAPLLEEVQPIAFDAEVTAPPNVQSCPEPCACHYEGEDFVVDCSGYELTQFPAPIGQKTTTLNLQNNKLTEIPKDVSLLKNLKILNAENNLIMDLALGSVSELPELTVLKLANNRLLDYPKDLKNSLILTKLEELDLGGNDMRSELKTETFSNLQALKKLTLAVSTPELIQALCEAQKSTLETVCTGSCNQQLTECSETEIKIEDGFMDATLPGTIPFEGDENDPVIKVDNVENSGTEKNIQESVVDNVDSTKGETTEEPKLTNENTAVVGSGRSIVGKQPEETAPQKFNNVVEAPNDPTTKSDSEIKVGATTTDTNRGGVSKSVIGIIVAGMVVVVAGITIKKNWSSITKRFSSTPRPAERAGANANGSAPEEVPLQEKDKSPV